MNNTGRYSKNLSSRRSFLSGLVATGTVIHLGTPLAITSKIEKPQNNEHRVVLGSGTHKYEWIKGWAKLPTGMGLGNTHGGIVIDSKGRIITSNDTEKYLFRSLNKSFVFN